MKKLRLIFAIIACKSAILLGNLLGKEASSAPGSLALKICPDILKLLSSQVKGEIIAVCGTNGKTTTNNLIYNFLTGNGYKVISNLYGANMLPGVCCAFAKEANIFGRLNADYACLEIDEASTIRVFGALQPHKMVITNLFRDQLDRYGEVSQTANMLKKALSLSPKTELIINCDDPYVSFIGTESKRVCHYIGVNEETNLNAEIDEGALCPICGEKLSYDYRHYSQLGKYFCPSCGFKRPEPTYKISNISSSGNLVFDIENSDASYHFDINYKGFYNIYNVSAAFATCRIVCGDIKNYSEILASYKPQIGRMQEFNIGKKLILNMSKNPAGFNQGIAAALADSSEKCLVLAVNDAPSDGIDVSWLWDVNFEKLSGANISKIYITGRRCDDLAVRLKYADITNFVVSSSYKDALESAKDDESEICYCLANYTATFKINEILLDMKA